MFSPFRIVIIFLFVCLASVLVVPSLRVDLLPREIASRLTVTFTLPNASPDIVEQQATAPLENALSQLTGLKKIESQSSYNRGQVHLTFDKRADMAMKKFETATIIRQVYPRLTANLSYPQVVQSSGKEGREKSALLVYTITGPASGYEVRRQAEEIFRKPLSQITGLQDLQFSGSENLQVSITYDQKLVNAFGVNPQEIPAAVLPQSHSDYPGVVTAGIKEHFIKVQQAEQSLASIGETFVKNGVRLKDVARVYLEEQEPQRHFRINGNNAISLALYAREGENAIVLADHIKATVQSAASSLPAGYEVRLEYDDTEFLRKELGKNYLRTGLCISILVAFIFLSYRNWRYMVTLVLSLVVNVSLTILLAWFFNINIHLYTLAGVAISFGIMIDNAIVMVDYYHQFRSRKVFLALLGATLTTITALLLVFLLPEEDRKNLTDFVSIIAITLGASLLSALLFTPGLYELLFRSKVNGLAGKVAGRWRVVAFRMYHAVIAHVARFRKVFVVSLILLFGLPVFMLPVKWEGQDWYNASVGSTIYQEKIRPYTDKLLGGALRLFVRNVFEKSSYRDASKTKLYVNAELPFGHTLEQMDFILGKMEEYLSTVGGIDKYVTHVYSGQYGNIEITFQREFENSSLPYQLKARLIARSLDWGGVSWSVYGVGQGFSNAMGEEIPSFRVRMKGYNYDELEHQAGILAGKLLGHKRIQKVNIDERLSYFDKSSHEYVLKIDPYQLSVYNATLASTVEHLQRMSKPTGPSAFVLINNVRMPLILKENGASEFSTWQMMETALNTGGDKMIKLKELAGLDLQKTSGTIVKENRQYIRVVGFEYYGSHHFGSRFLDEKLNEMRAQMPIGYTTEKLTWQWDFGRVKRQYSLVMLLIVVNFIICSILFESLRKPFFIIATVPVSFIGLFLLFALFDFYFDQGGYAAFVLLGGLVVNASIFIVNDFNNSIIKGKNKNRVLLKVVANRSRTILMTVLSTCCGMIPFLIEGQNEVFWFSLAIGTIGGLLMSLFAVFVVLPVLMWRRSVN